MISHTSQMRAEDMKEKKRIIILLWECGGGRDRWMKEEEEEEVAVAKDTAHAKENNPTTYR